jgi:hypothetical protein
VRGGGPLNNTILGQTLAAFPRARGWTDDAGGLPRGLHGFPPCAGVDRSRSTARSGCTRLSPVRGGGPLSSREITRIGAAFPRARGWTALRIAAMVGCGGFPPVRGGGPLARSMSLSAALAFPCARGWIRGTSRLSNSEVQCRGFSSCTGANKSSVRRSSACSI